MFADNHAFRQHVEAMVAARDQARATTGERKGYLANLICEADELAERWDIIKTLGVDGALVAPALQGFSTLSMLARERRMPLLAHNTFSDLLSRHPGWGIEHAVLCGLYQAFGADWIVTSASTGPPTASAWRTHGHSGVRSGRCRSCRAASIRKGCRITARRSAATTTC